MTLLLSALGVLVAAFIKGAIGIGFPTLATPLLSLVVDVKTAVVVLILPNIVMDGIQLVRRGAPLRTVRRLAVLLGFGAAGMVLGTGILIVLPPPRVLLVLGVFVLLFVALNATPVRPRVPARWEWWLSPLVGLVAGIVGGITNVPGTPLAIYFYALRMDKDEFVRSVAVSFLVYKLVQLGAVSSFGLLSWRLVAVSAGLTVVGLAAFRLGLAVQDRLEQGAFNRLVLVFLAGLGVALVIRATRW
jgi:uncharacterized membrane protein YfcA